MTLKRLNLFHRLHTPVTLLLILFLIAGCGGSESSGPAPSGGGAPDPKFSLPLPKGLLAPSVDSGLTMTAKAVIDPGSAGARTIDLTIDSSANRVTGVIDEVAEGPHSIEIQYFINGVQVAIAALNVNVVAGQNTPVEISPTLVNYTEAVSNALFVADGSNQSIAIFDHYSNLPGGTVPATPTRTLAGPDTHISGPSSGGLFVDSLRGILYLTNAGNNSVAIWNNAATVSGNTPPDRLLAGSATRLNHPTGITVDPFRNRLYVVNQNGGPNDEILIWDTATPVNGNTAPIASVSGSVSALAAGGDHPLSLDIKSDTLYVANGTEILVFDKLSQLTGDHRDVAPVPTIRLTGTSLTQAGLALDPIRDLLFISSRNSNGTIYKVTGASAVLGDTTPAATLIGPETGLNQASTITTANNILMATNQGGSEVRVWHQADQKDGNASPTQILQWSAPTPPALPAVLSALFYVATQNVVEDQSPNALDIVKSGSGRGRVTSDLPGINCGTTCSSPFPAGSKVTLTAVAESGSAFTGWSGTDCNGVASCTVTVDTAKTVTATFNDTQPPTAPSNLTVATAGVSQLNLSWNASADNIGIAGYWIDRCQGAGCTNFSRLNSTLVSTTNFSDTGLVNNTTYRYRVQAADAAGNLSPFSVPASGTTAPNPVLTLNKSGTGVGSITSSPNGINCGTTCSAPFAPNTSITLTASATAGSTFAGFGGACTSSSSPCTFTITANAIVTATFNDTQAPTAPSNLTASAIGTSQINLTWNASTDNIGVTGYRLERCQGANCTTFTQIATPTTTSFSNTGLSANTSYTYRVRAVDAAGTLSSFSATASATTSANPILNIAKPGTGAGSVTSSPTGINCGATCSAPFAPNTSITLTASATAGSTFAGFGGACTSATTSCTFTITGNAPVTVTATFNDTQAPTAPSGLTASAIGTSQINLTWNASTDNTGVTGYRLERCQGAGCTVFTQIATPTATTFSDTGLSDNTTYTYRVRAVDAAVNLGPYSATVSATTAANPTLVINKTGLGAGTVTSSPTGINCGATCSAPFAPNTSITLTASATAGSTFAGFGGACTSATTSCTFTITGNAPVTVTTTFNDTQAPTAPSGLTATAIGSSQINLTWNASTDNIGIAGYWIERCQGAGCTNFSRLNTSLVSTTNFSDTGLTPGVSYSYRVQAADAAAIPSPYSNIATATTLDNIAPTPPSNLSATAVSNSLVNLSWTPSTDNVGVTGYQIERCQGGGCTNFSQIDTVAATTYSDTGLAEQVTYQYRVRAVDGAGNPSLYSNISAVTTLDKTPPTISNVASASITSSGAIITWTTNEASDSQVEYGQTASYGSATPVDATKVTSHSVTVSGLSDATLYHYQVKSRDAAGNPSSSTDFTFITADGTPPTAPSNLSATAASSSEIDLSWSPSIDFVGVSGYWIERCQGAGCSNFARINTSLVSGTGYSDTTLVSGNSYSYRVQAADAAGNPSAYSNTVSAITMVDLSVGIVPSGTGGVGSITGPGIDCTGAKGSTCSGSYPLGTTITLTAQPDPSSIFSGWSGACTGPVPTCTLVFDSDKVVQAQFDVPVLP